MYVYTVQINTKYTVYLLMTKKHLPRQFVFWYTVLLNLCLSPSVTVPQGQRATVTRLSSSSRPTLPHLSSLATCRGILGAITNITYLFALSFITNGTDEESHGDVTFAPPSHK